MGYAALHCHSYYSLLDGTMSPELVAEAACTSGMEAAALVDRDTLAGSVQFYKKARKLGLHAVTGAEVTLGDGSSLVLLVENARGYRNLSRLITAGASDETLEEYSGGLICLAGPRSGVGRAILMNESPEPVLKKLEGWYGRNLALELTPHNDDDLRLARLFAELGRKRRIPVATAVDSHYLEAGDRLRYDILQSMRTLTLLNQRHEGKLPAGRHHWQTEDDVRRYFGGLPQAMANTARIAERCQFDFELGDLRFPKYPCQDAVELLRAKVRAGVERRYGLEPEARVWERLEREMGVIEEVGYAEYFLVFADIVEWCAGQGIWTLARGSAAGSLVCYVLGISNVCPFRFGLCFERFLNRERMQFAKLADIDLDLPWDRRDEVIRYVFERYGREHVAMIGAVHTFQGRSAVAEIAKVYGIPEREARRFTEHLPWHRGDAEAAVRGIPECRELPFQEEPYKTVLAMAGSLDGIPRHFAMHPCGLVVSGDPVADRMPLFESAKGLMTTHYAMDDVEELGLLKLDLLGQAGLSVLRDTLTNLEENGREKVALEKLDWNDEPTWAMIAGGRARGVFHIESPAMTSLLVMTNCRDMDCLTAVESIIRPGAANEGKKRAYARRHQGLEEVTFAHPSLEPLLADTYGLMAYEEHILLVANGFAGMAWGRADLLRRALVKNRDRERIEELGREFQSAARALGRTEEETARVWGMLREFAGYMFNKAHSAAYAVEAYSGAWLKGRYPVEFLAAVLTSRRGFYSPMLYVLEALQNGARFLTPDLVESDLRRFLVKGETIRLPLDQVRGLTQGTLERIGEQRPFEDVGSFFRKVKPSRAEWLALLKAGALDGFEEPRGRLFWRLQRLEASAQAERKPLLEAELPESFDSGVAARARWEHEVLGFPVSVHPLEYFAPRLDWGRFISAEQLAARQQALYGKEVRVAGLVVADRHHPTENGTMKFLTLADRTGFLEVSLFAQVYRDYGHLTVHPVVAVEAVVDAFDNRHGFALNGQRVLKTV
ncbi:MAG: DNA polymerase III subunit alpha [Acidobacteria bacterium]|nr:DNA polymerase III subunit alpha [Acidobacteriota bacterium]